MEKYLNLYYKCLAERALTDGGFPSHKGLQYSPDSTAWAVLAFKAFDIYHDLALSARSRLSKSQLQDGRVALSLDCLDVIWPTSLAILAWQGSKKHYPSQLRAVESLLGYTGEHYERKKDSPFAHDTAIKGWPWILKTHSWVEPTSLALLALEIAGKGEHERAKEGRQMLLDRQLDSGGWNYGNTRVFGKELRPMPESTGLVLNSLAGRVNRGIVEKSISYLKKEFDRLHTPLSIGWGAIGLSACGERPANVEESVLHCLEFQEEYGPYTTEELSIILISLGAKAGLLSIFDKKA